MWKSVGQAPDAGVMTAYCASGNGSSSGSKRRMWWWQDDWVAPGGGREDVPLIGNRCPDDHMIIMMC